MFTVEHFGLPAKDPAALKDWYVGVLGGKLVYEIEQTPPAFFVEIPGGLILEICQGKFALRETGDNSLNGWRHLALQVSSIDDARKILEARGVRFQEPVKPAGGGGKVLFFSDPEGNLLHLVERPQNSIFLEIIRGRIG